MANKERNKFCELIESFSDEDMYVILVSFMSADTLVDLKTCENAYSLLEEVIAALKEANISEKKRNAWLDYANKSRDVIVREIENFKAENNE